MKHLSDEELISELDRRGYVVRRKGGERRVLHGIAQRRFRPELILWLKPLRKCAGN